MKKYYILEIQILFVFSFIFPNSFRAQPYIPLLNSSSEWHVTSCYFGCLTDKYYTTGDTVINSLHYKFLDQYHYNKNFIIREDTISRKVFMRVLSDPSPAKEYLLYDFSLHVNDTTSIKNPSSPYPQYAGSFIVDSIKLKPLVNKTHRFFYLHAVDTIIANTKTTIWVEGIGSLCLINTPGAMPQINGVGQLSCYFYNGINEYKQLDSIADCVAIYTTGIKDIKKETNFHVTQNFDLKNISFSTNDEDIYKIQIYTVDGRLIFLKENISNYLEINSEQLSPGLLLLKIENKKGNYYTCKLFNP